MATKAGTAKKSVSAAKKASAWMEAHPNGIAKIVDKRALRLIKKGFSPLEALRLSVKIDEIKEAKLRCRGAL